MVVGDSAGLIGNLKTKTLDFKSLQSMIQPRDLLEKTTRQIQCFGRIGLISAGGVDQIKRNGGLSRDFERNEK